MKYFYFLSKGLLYKYIAPQTTHNNCIHGKLDTVKFTDDVTDAHQWDWTADANVFLHH